MIQSYGSRPRKSGETVRLRLTDGRIIAAYFNEDRRAWCWLNGHAGMCWIDEADEGRLIAGWAPLGNGFPLGDDLAAISDTPAPIPTDTWFIWQKRGHPPRFAHSTEEGALEEAARLARRRPGDSFIVMHAIHKVRVEAVATAAQPSEVAA